jgi:hypothetical protein
MSNQRSHLLESALRSEELETVLALKLLQEGSKEDDVILGKEGALPVFP